MTSGPANNEVENARVMERWFTEGWAGNEQLADEIFCDQFSNNDVVVGPAGPKRNIRGRLAGFPDLTSVVEQLLTVEDKAILRLRWKGTHTGPYLGVPATGKRVDVRGMTIWRFENGKVLEDWTVGHIPLAIYGVRIPPPLPGSPPTGASPPDLIRPDEHTPRKDACDDQHARS